MTKDTDSQAKARWEDLQREKATGRTPEGTTDAQYRRHLQEREQDIRSDWNDILHQRREGRLTDTGRVDRVRQVIEEFASQMRVPLLVTGPHLPGPVNDWFDSWRSHNPDEEFPDKWEIRAMYTGNTRELSWNVWKIRCDELDDRLRALGYVERAEHFHRVNTLARELPRDYEERNYSQPGAPPISDDEEEDDEDKEEQPPRDGDSKPIYADPYLRPVACWLVDTWVWDGPPATGRSRAR